ncbi:MAG: hypothetical protein ACR2O3_01700 [Rhizobiaceae bacterium]
MWKIFGRAHSVVVASIVITSAALSLGGEAYAQSTFINQNISGFNLPGVTLPSGHDEVRAADGTTCRSAVSGNGAYVDVGVIGNPEQSTTDSSVSAYTRVVIPLGEKRDRIDCGKLYNLEVRRLEIELKLMELGLNRGIAPVSEVAEESIGSVPNEIETSANTVTKPDTVKVADASDKNWADDGWTTNGLNQ